MTKSYLLNATLICAFLLAFSLSPTFGSNEDDKGQYAIAPNIVADYIHAVIQAYRTLYTTHVVQRMEDNKIVTAQEYWKQTKALPLPAQMLLFSGLQVMQQGVGLQFRLASLTPIYEKNGPTTEFEKTGLAAVINDPDKPHTGIIQRGEGKFFKAIYADKAVSSVNAHHGS